MATPHGPRRARRTVNNYPVTVRGPLPANIVKLVSKLHADALVAQHDAAHAALLTPKDASAVDGPHPRPR